MPVQVRCPCLPPAALPQFLGLLPNDCLDVCVLVRCFILVSLRVLGQLGDAMRQKVLPHTKGALATQLQGQENSCRAGMGSWIKKGSRQTRQAMLLHELFAHT